MRMIRHEDVRRKRQLVDAGSAQDLIPYEADGLFGREELPAMTRAEREEIPVPPYVVERWNSCPPLAHARCDARSARGNEEKAAEVRRVPCRNPRWPRAEAGRAPCCTAVAQAFR